MGTTDALVVTLAAMLSLVNVAVLVLFDYAWWESRRGELPGFAPTSRQIVTLHASVALSVLLMAWVAWMCATGRL